MGRIPLLIVFLALAMIGVPMAVGADDGPIAVGLDNPRGIDVAPNGVIYVAEAGRGGDGPCYIGGEGEVCLGATGAVTAITRHGQHRVLDGLPSAAAADGNSATGPHDVDAATSAVLYVSVGLGSDPAVTGPGGSVEGSGLGVLHRFNLARNATRVEADLAAYEAAMNPDGGVVDSNPYGIAVHRGSIVVADAGGNDVLSVRRGGGISTLAVLPPQLADAPPFLGLPPGTQIPSEAVPTGVDVDRDGTVYVGILTGFPFPVGGAAVHAIDRHANVSVAADGFTNIVDVAVGRDGSLYVVELATNGLLSGDLTGAVTRVHPDGSRTTVGDLFAPGGVAVDRHGNVYATVCSVCAGGGAVLHLDL